MVGDGGENCKIKERSFSFSDIGKMAGLYLYSMYKSPKRSI